jgi:hypothetical protein
MGIYFRIVKSSFLFLLGGVLTPLFSTSISIINDSAFNLNAQVLDRTGRLLDLIHLVAGQMYIYDVSQGSFEPNSDQTYTPFTIIFLCESGRPYDYSTPKKEDQTDPDQKKEKPSEYISQFGIWTDVPRGATITALGSPQGTKSCVMRKHAKLVKRKKSDNSTNAGSGNWSNDGGQSWSNDAGSGDSSCSRGDGSCLNAQGRRQRPTRGGTSSSQNQETFMTEQGDVWSNDGGQGFSNDSSVNSGTSSQKPDPSEDAAGKWSNDEQAPHIPSKKTPLPFKSRTSQ